MFSVRYNPIQQLAPQDCVSRINAIVDKIDSLVAANNTEGIQQLKDIFGLGELEDIRDFAMTIAFPRTFCGDLLSKYVADKISVGGPMNYPTNTWQASIPLHSKLNDPHLSRS